MLFVCGIAAIRALRAKFATKSPISNSSSPSRDKSESDFKESTKAPTQKQAKGIVVLTPFKPMLAEACKTFQAAFKKCPNGIFAEIKYDGERIQVHKSGEQWAFFARSLKPGSL